MHGAEKQVINLADKFADESLDVTIFILELAMVSLEI